MSIKIKPQRINNVVRPSFICSQEEDSYDHEDEKYVVEPSETKEKHYTNGLSNTGFVNSNVSNQYAPRLREKNGPHPTTYDSDSVTITKM